MDGKYCFSSDKMQVTLDPRIHDTRVRMPEVLICSLTMANERDPKILYYLSIKVNWKLEQEFDGGVDTRLGYVRCVPVISSHFS